MKRRPDSDFRDEIEAHILLEIDQLIEEGMTPAKAERQARRAFGNVTKVREDFYESNRILWLDHLRRNVIYALRQMRRSPISSAVIILTLALGIGLNASNFQIAYRATFADLPIRDPGSLVQLQWDGPFVVAGMGGIGFGHLIPFPLYRELEEHTDVFSTLLARAPAGVHLNSGGATRHVTAEIVTGTYFPGLGVRPAAGRLLSPDDDKNEGGHPVVVLSHALWQGEFAGSDGALGRQIRINGVPLTIIGVTEPNFLGTDRAHAPGLFLPMAMKEAVVGWGGLDEHRSRFAHVFARLQPDTSRERAETALQPFFRSYLRADTELADWPSVSDERLAGFLNSQLRVIPGGRGQSQLTSTLARPLVILVGAALLVFLLACLNVANLSIARAFARSRATALRAALGASRRRIIGETLVESGIFALCGGLLGALLAPLVSHLVLGLLGSSSVAVPGASSLDLHTVLFALVASLVVTVIAGVAPAVVASKASPTLALSQKSPSGLAGLGLRRGLVVGQFALAVVLLMGASLFARTLGQLRAEGPGFDTTNLLMFQVSPAKDGYENDSSKRLVRELESELSRVPGVTSVAAASFELLTGSGWNNPVTVTSSDGLVPTDMSVPMNAVSADFFETLDLAVLSGRGFDERDQHDEGWDLRSVLVNRELVDRYLGGESPVGQRLAFGNAPDARPEIEIVGVVETFRDFGLREPKPQVFFSLWERVVQRATFYVRAEMGSEPAAAAIRQAVRDLDPDLTVLSLRTLDDQLDRLLVNERVLSAMAVTFAVVATLLAMIGLYGVLSFSAQSRHKEIGIRMALGAPRRSAAGLIVREAALMVVVGLAVALPVTWLLTDTIRSLLFGVDTLDLETLFSTVLPLMAVTLIAAALPARSLSRVDPNEALRAE